MVKSGCEWFRAVSCGFECLRVVSIRFERTSRMVSNGFELLRELFRVVLTGNEWLRVIRSFD